jgi:hypothetical protein
VRQYQADYSKAVFKNINAGNNTYVVNYWSDSKKEKAAKSLL